MFCQKHVFVLDQRPVALRSQIRYDSTHLQERSILPRDRTGDLVNSGERTPGETIVEYQPRIIGTVPECGWSWADRLEQHRLDNFYPRRDVVRPAVPSFKTRSLRRI
jgi:hypothetical protein